MGNLEVECITLHRFFCGCWKLAYEQTQKNLCHNAKHLTSKERGKFLRTFTIVPPAGKENLRFLRVCNIIIIIGARRYN